MLYNDGKTFRKLTGMDGIIYYLRSITDVPIISRIALVVKVGSMMEDHNEYGLSHFLEHMLVDKMKYPVQDNHIPSGLFCHAYTNFYETVYLFYNNQSKEDDAYTFISDCMNGINEIISGTGLNPDAMERVRRDVQNEHSTSVINKETAIKQLFMDEYPNIHLSIGDISFINSFSFDDVFDYHRKWYTPDNAAIIIESNLEAEKIELLIAKKNTKLQTDPLITDHSLNNENGKWSCESKAKEKHNENFSPPGLYFISKYRRLISSPEKYMESLINLDLALEAFKLIVRNYLSLQGMQDYDVDGEVEIFSSDWHLVRFRIAFDENIIATDEIIHYLKTMELNKNIFYKTQKICHQKIDDNTKDYSVQGKDFFINECIQNFLFSEPIFELIDEINLAHNAIDKASFKAVQGCFDYIKRNCVLIHRQNQVN